MNEIIATAVDESAVPPSALNRLFDSEIAYSFRRQPVEFTRLNPYVDNLRNH